MPYQDDDHLAQALYRQMHERGESWSEAGAALELGPAELAQACEHLIRLHLIDAETGTAVDAAAALARSLRDSHRALDRLVEQHVRAALLAQRYLGLPGRRTDDTHIEFFARTHHQERLYQRIDELTELTRHEIASMHPAAPWTSEVLEKGLARNRVSIGNGLRVRSLHAQITFADPMMREYVNALAEEGVEVRAAPLIPTRMLIYDRHTAIVQADPEDLDAGAVLIQGDGVVRSLSALYDYCWMTASEPEDVPRTADGVTLTEAQRAVLRLLASGAKDTAIARGLGVSVRTVTRTVGELTTILGATSRFQAGVRAARLGWLD
ncbi:LuxR C-terminal-related transcriptional regulator [Nonomuraea sp. NPDC050383]|uniref:helix-turn-helix transcriptional regulator n=1 Tax=Nonomuraea sp. NPDC050383 TaxID=3364362 RepID=UPI0037A86C4C